MSRTVVIPAALAGSRLDVALAKLTGLSRSQVQRKIREGFISKNGSLVQARNSVATAELFMVTEPDKVEAFEAPNIPILYEDVDVIAIDKPAGLVVHASESGRPQPTVAAFATAHGVVDDDAERPGIVHRLDKDTSGVMLIAKHKEAKTDLQRQFRARSVEKTYTALVQGRLKLPEALIELPIGRDRKHPIKRAVVPGTRQATTRYRVIREYPSATLIEVNLHTGRTHQIRVHFSYVGHAVVGDTLYTKAKRPLGLTRQFLHAARISYVRLDGTKQTVASTLPLELQHYLETLSV